MANFILIHGTGGSPQDCFYPWLKKELEKLGNTVCVPQLPKPKEQNLASWLEAFKPYEKLVNEDTIFVARSIGPAFVLRLLEKLDIEAKAAFLIAGFCSDIGLEEFNFLISTFIGKPFRWKKIRRRCSRFFVYAADNDRYVPIENSRELAKKLHTKMILVKGADHFYFRRFPKLLNDIKAVLK